MEDAQWTIVEIDRIYDTGLRALAFAKRIQEAVDKAPAEYRADVRISFVDNGHQHKFAGIHYRRPKTAEELAAKSDQQGQRGAEAEREERANLRRLQAKYPDLKA